MRYFSEHFPSSVRTHAYMQLLDTALVALRALDSADFAETLTSFPLPYSDYPDLEPSASPPFNLPSVLVPPEIIELDGLSTDAGEDAQVKKEEWPEYFLRLFDAGVCIWTLFAPSISDTHPQ